MRFRVMQFKATQLKAVHFKNTQFDKMQKTLLDPFSNDLFPGGIKAST
jgi:hypothetical protein